MKNLFTSQLAKCLFSLMLIGCFIQSATAQNALDKLGITSALPAAGAYFLRQLSSTYSGPLVRITIGGSYYDIYPDATTAQTISLTSPISAAYVNYNDASTGATTNTLGSIVAGQTATVAIWYD